MADNEPASVEEGKYGINKGYKEDTTSTIPSFSDFEESLLSLERLDRSSPELWPEKIPGVTEFMSFYTPPNNTNTRPVYSTTFTAEDNNLLHQFASLSTSGLIAKVKELHDVAYQLGVEEAKEMTRGKYLNLFKRTNSRVG